jgi:hypothetical protein
MFESIVDSVGGLGYNCRIGILESMFDTPGTRQEALVNTSTLLETTPAAPVERSVRVRLTRRGQGVVLVTMLAGIFAAGLAYGASAHGADGEPAAATPHRTVVVQPGQTLWAIAREAAPHRDPRVVVESIRQLNALPGAVIQAGQQLLLP